MGSLTKMKYRKNIRLKNYDYKTNGFHFVTICTTNKKPLLKKYRNDAEQILQGLPSRFTGIKLGFYCFMPEHLNIIFILNDVNASFGEIIRTYKALVTRKTGFKPFWK